MAPGGCGLSRALEAQASLFSLFLESVPPFSFVWDCGAPGRDGCLFSESACCSPTSPHRAHGPWQGRAGWSCKPAMDGAWQGHPLRGQAEERGLAILSGGRCEGQAESGLGGQGGWRRKVAAGKGVARSLGRAAAVAGPGVIGVSRAEQVSAFFTLET